MSQRLKLSRAPAGAASRSFYYLKRELADFCKESGLPASGSKAEFTDRIVYFLDTGNVLKSSAERKTVVNIGTLTEKMDGNIAAEYNEGKLKIIISFLNRLQRKDGRTFSDTEVQA